MTPTRQGSVRLFTFKGIEVYLHWSWFLVAAWAFYYRSHNYRSPLWNALEYVALFVIVLMHEFGHALACRQVGGQANQIVLWPLGGVAYVAPPQRPGATLWSLAAGPLVNVILAPILIALVLLARRLGWEETAGDAYKFIGALCVMNIVILCFNMLPVYPLDGGQILRSLLWYVVGRARSLMVASVIGIAGVVVLGAFALLDKNPMLGILTVFILLNCWSGLMHARVLARLAAAPRREGFLCPVCKVAPPRGPFWGCGKCRKGFDPFETQATCPHCGEQYPGTMCPECGNLSLMAAWVPGPPPLPK